MATEEVGMTLLEELVERILAMVPFPYIFKARVLSKSWLARLSPISPQDDDEKKRLAISFQKLVGEQSTKWKTFSPVFVGKEGLIAYHQASDRWLRPGSLSFVPEKLRAQPRRWKSVQVDGALVLIQTPAANLYVVNVLTKTWKHILPPCPETKAQIVVECLVSHASSGTYKVIKFHHLHKNDTGPLLALIYDSKSNAWSRKMINLPGNFQVREHRVYFHGLYYWLVRSIDYPCLPRALMAFNFEEETFEIFQVPHTAIPTDLRRPPISACLAVCNASLLMVVCGAMRILTVLKIDLESQRWLEVARRPFPGDLDLLTNPLSSDGNCIFLVEQTGASGTMLAYNVGKDELSFSPIPDFLSGFYFSRRGISNSPSFEPGLNPFVAV